MSEVANKLSNEASGEDVVVDIPLSSRTEAEEERVTYYLATYKERLEEIGMREFPVNKVKHKRVEIPVFKNAREKRLWEEEEIKRCIKGHKGMSGKMYFFFNYSWMINLKKGKFVPEYRVVDDEWFRLLEDTKKEGGWGIVCVKRRRVGASWKEAADALHDVLFTPFSVVGMNSKTQTDSRLLFEKVMFVFENLPQFLRIKVGSKTKDSIEFYRLQTDDLGNKVKRGHQSYITVKAPTVSAFEGHMLNKWICDEAGKQPELPQMWSFTEDTMMQETERIGMPVLFGTSGEIGKAGAGLKAMWDNAEAHRLHKFFFAGYMGIGVDEYGNDNIEKCIRWIVYERKRYASISSKAYSDFLQKYPLTISEAFNQSSEGGLGDIVKIKAQMDAIDADPPKATKGRFKPDKNKDITFVPDPLGEVVVYEHAKKGMKDFYVAGCLPAGEKVMTGSGLKDIEKVTFDDKLVNKDGEVVDILELQRYKVDEPLYEVKMANTYRTTRFTGEHPIYISENKKGYNGEKKRAKGEKYSYQKFDFSFNPIKDIEEGSWTKVPNIYKGVGWEPKEKWKQDSDFWWLAGLWLGDGWIEKNKYVKIACDPAHRLVVTKLESIIKSKFNAKIYRRKRNGVIEIGIKDQQLAYTLVAMFNRGAKNKTIPEKVKTMKAEYKLGLLAGYLDSDGCVTYDKRRDNYGLEFVSISLELVEGVQDLLFSVGIINSSSKLRDAQVSFIRGRKVQQQDTYRVRVSHYWTRALHDLGAPSIKLQNVELREVRENKMGCFFSEDEEYIYFQIESIEVSHIDDYVYNFHCDTNNYICRHISTHNCDPADHDKDDRSKLSDLSLYIMKKAHGTSPPQIVAQYTARPKKLAEYYQQAIMMLQYYGNCKVLIESNRSRMIAHFDENGFKHLLHYTPQGIIKLTGGRSTSIGINMTEARKDYLADLCVEYIDDHCSWIPDKELLKEFPKYGAENTDRIIGFGLALMLLKEDKTVSRKQSAVNPYIPTAKFVKDSRGNIIRQRA